jgi:hypothetical protein
VLTFDPDSPWEVGQVVIFREGEKQVGRKVVVSVEQSEDGMETQYTLENPDAGLYRYCIDTPQPTRSSDGTDR